MYKKIKQLLDERRVKEALIQLGKYAQARRSWQWVSNIELTERNYTCMLISTSTEDKDPKRNIFYRSILRHSYQIADYLAFDEHMSTSNSPFGEIYRMNKNKPVQSYKKFAEELVNWNIEKGLYTKEEAGNEFVDHHQYPIHSEFDNKLFNKIVTSTLWVESQYSNAFSILDKGMSTFDIEVMISAITLSLMQYYDWYKFYFLINVYLSKKITTIKCRALVGIALTLYYYEDRIKLEDPDNLIILEFLMDSNTARRSFQFIQQAFLITRETEKIDKKMREEILPEIMKNPFANNPDKTIEIMDLNDLDQSNPEWQQNINRITKQVQELSELQREGADTFMGTFAMLKHYQFFKETAHWFYPFNVKEDNVHSLMKDKNIEKGSILDIMFNSHAFCSSDKYSFCMALDEIPAHQIQMLGKDMNAKEELFNNEVQSIQNLSANMKRRICFRQYIQDLYRFYKLWDYRNQLHDIFSDPLTLWNSSYLHDLLTRDENGMENGSFLLDKGYYKEAEEIFTRLQSFEPLNIEIKQKLGFAQQKLGKYKTAIETYKFIALVDPQDSWTIKQIAHCYKKMHYFKEAVKYLQKASKLEPENLNITLQIGQCLTSLYDYNEAIKYFFKVEYLGKANEKTHRAIAWCYFKLSKYDEAEKFYEKIIKESKPTVNDWVNFGHVKLLQKDWISAVDYYKKASKLCSSHDEFIKLFRADSHVLLKEKKIDEVSFYILQELAEI